MSLHVWLIKLIFFFDAAGKFAPSSRWGHTLTAISEKEAVVIGGQGDKQTFCKDSIWYLNMGEQVVLFAFLCLVW